jgi:HAD superfamily hydrolase (TIGR01509 family)
MPHALIFDFDGLIADTESAIYEAWAELYGKHGEELGLAEYVQCVGSTFGQFDPMAELERRLGRTLDWAPLLEAKDAVIRARHEGLPPLPGVRELLEQAAAAGVPCAVASSSSADWVRPWLRKFDLNDAFQAIWTRDRVQEVKPSPELFLGAAADLGRAPGRCLVLEDSYNGLRAAQTAGSPCVIVPSPVTRGSDFSAAHRILPSLAHTSLADLLEIIPESTEVQR